MLVYTNQSIKKVPKVLKAANERTCLQTLGISPISPPSLPH